MTAKAKSKRNKNSCIFCQKPGRYYYDRKLIHWLNDKYKWNLNGWVGLYLCDACMKVESDEAGV